MAGKYMNTYILPLTTLCFAISLSKAFHLKLTKVQCEILDESVVSINECRVVAVSRNVQYLSVDIKLKEAGITSFSGVYTIMKRANGYKPFLYNVTLNCFTIAHLNPVTRIAWTWLKSSSNINTSCPINVTNISMPRMENSQIVGPFEKLPMPCGDYALFNHWSFNNKTAFTINIFGVIY